MFDVDDYLKVRCAVQIEGLSKRAAARRFGIDPKTVAKMMSFSVPPGYVRTKPPVRPKLDAFTAIIDKILADDRSRPKKQQHTSKRIFERLRDEHGFTGGITIVKDYVAGVQQRAQEMFVPLVHPPGHAQADFGEALAVIGGVERKIHYFAFDLPHSDANFVVAYPAETTEAFCDGHVQAFAFFGSLAEPGPLGSSGAGVPQSILYDNTKIAVAKILGDGKRQRTRVFTELQSHYLFRDRFGRPAKGNDKGKVEGLVGYARRNFMVPVPVFDTFAALNAHLANSCRKRLGEVLRGETETIGVRLQRDLAAFRQPLPPSYDACEKLGTRVSSLSLVRYRLNDYSVPTSYGHAQVLVRGYVHEVVISSGTEIIARHPRSYEREDFVFDPLHYLALIEQKINALDQAAPLADWKLPEEFATLRRLLEARMGKPGKREFVQVLRLMETFTLDDVAAAVRDAIQRGAIGFDAVKHLVLCRIERRPPRLNMAIYPYLPKATVATTSAGAYMELLSGCEPACEIEVDTAGAAA
jgi:transposase